MKLKRLDKPISYWYDKGNCNIVYVLYQLFTTLDKTMLGKIPYLWEACSSRIDRR